MVSDSLSILIASTGLMQAPHFARVAPEIKAPDMVAMIGKQVREAQVPEKATTCYVLSGGTC